MPRQTTGSQRQRGRTSNRAKERRNKPKTAQSRTKADNLTYDPQKWDKQKYVIMAHLSSSPICSAIVTDALPPPPISPNLAVQLLMDDSRDQAERPPTPNPKDISPIFWDCTSTKQCIQRASTLLMNDPRRYPKATTDLMPQDFFNIHGTQKTPIEIDNYAYHEYHNQLVEYQQAMAAAETAEAKDQLEGPPVHPREVAYQELTKWHKDLATWRSTHQSDMARYVKLKTLIARTLESHSALQEYQVYPVHYQALTYQSANHIIYSFFDKFIGRKHKHLKTNAIKQQRDGHALFKACNWQRARPSTNSGAIILNKITSAKQQPGQPYAAFVDYVIYDLGEQYQEATGKPPDQSLMRMPLTQNIQDFYKQPMSALMAQEALSDYIIPVIGKDRSISAVMERFQNEHPKQFTKYLNKKAKRNKRNQDNNRNEEANTAQQQRNQRRGNKNKGQSNEKTFDCTWCLVYRPGSPTKHTEAECRIKRDNANIRCDICNRLGHPAKFCPSKTGRANLASHEESKEPEANLSTAHSVSRPLTAKEARNQLRSLEATSKHSKFKIVEVPAQQRDL